MRPVATLLACCAMVAACAQAPLPLQNPGFETDADGDGLPDQWTPKIAEAGAVALDAQVRHSGSRAVRIRQTNPGSYSSVFQGVPNEWPGQRLLASVWVKCEDIKVRGIGPRLYCGYEGGLGHHAGAPVLDDTGSCDWQQVLVPFNTRDKQRVEIYLYLHESTGTIWFDDLRVVPDPFEIAPARFAAPPIIDGFPTDNAWTGADQHTMVWTEDGSEAPGRTLRLAHDQTTLFALATVPAAVADENPRKGPHVTLAVDPDRTGDVLTFSISPDGTTWAGSAEGPVPTGKWQAAVQIAEGLLSAEFAIPLETLSLGLATTHTWGINVVDSRPADRDAELIFTRKASLNGNLLADAHLPGLNLEARRMAELKRRLRGLIDGYGAWVEDLDIDRVPKSFAPREAVARQVEDFGARIVDMSRAAAALTSPSDDQWREAADQLAALEQDLQGLQRKALPVAGYALARKFAKKPTWTVGVETSARKVLRDPALFQGAATDTIKLFAAKGEGESVQLVIMPLAGNLENVRIKLPAALKGPLGARIPESAFELNTVGYVRAEKPAYKRDTEADWWPDVLLPYAPLEVKRGEVQPVWLTVWVPRDAAAGVYSGTITLTAGNAHKVALDLKLRVYDFELPTRPALRTSFGLGSAWLSRYYFGDEDPLKTIDGPTYQRWCNELLRHRISPYLGTDFHPQKQEDGSYSFEPWESNLAYCMDRGQTSTMLRIMPGTPNSAPDYDDQFKATFREDLTAVCDRLKQRKWLDNAYVCAWDEPREGDYAGVIAGHKLIRATDPDLDILQTVCYDDEPSGLVGDVDIWCPITSRWNPEFYAERQAADEEVWWYVCCSPHPPHANFFIDQPAIDHRVLFWQTWQRKVSGLLYWQTTWWDGNVVNGGTKQAADPARWVNASYKAFKANGDGHLLYPGEDLAPLSSLRLAVIRDGVEDYDYFALLQDAIERSKLSKGILDEARQLLEIGPEFSRALTKFTRDPEVLETRRRSIAEMIERLHRVSADEG